MKTAEELISDALLQTGVIPQEADQIPPYLTKQSLILLNDIIMEWGGMTSQIPYNNPPVHFDFEMNKESYSFGLSNSYDVNTRPIIDIISMTYFVDYPTNQVNYSMRRITEFQYANIGFKRNSAYPSEYLLRIYPDHSEVIIQALPSQTQNATLICKQRLMPVDLYQNLSDQFPDNFYLPMKYRLMLDILDSQGMEASQSLQNKYTKAMDNLMASNKVDLTLNNSERLSRNSRFSTYLYGVYGI